MFTTLIARRKPFFSNHPGRVPEVRRASASVALAVGMLFCAVFGVRADDVLLMVEQDHCEWCEAWNAEIGGVYAKTDEGRRAPLRRVNLFEPMPSDVTIVSAVHYTPTFILLEDGRESGRIEGYPGEHFFWPMLNQLFEKADKAEGQEGPKK